MKKWSRIFVVLLAAVLAYCAAGEEPKPAPAAAPPPAFPVQSDWFDQIVDGYDNQEAAMQIEKLSMLDIVAAVKAGTPEHLAANIDKNFTFRKLMVKPEDFRGHVVQFDSTFRYSYDDPLETEDALGNKIVLYRGQVTSRGNHITFASFEPPPKELKPGETVRFTGVFMKRFPYLNRSKPGADLTWTPLVFVKKLEPYKDEELKNDGALFAGYIFFAMMAVAMFFYLSYRKGKFVRKSNYFTHVKRARDGGDRLFPKSGGDKLK